MIGLQHHLVLNSDIVIRRYEPPPSKDSPENRADDFVVTRTASRSPSLAVNRATVEFLLAFSRPCALLSAVQLISKRTTAAPETVLEEVYPSLKMFLNRGILVRLGGTRRGEGWRNIGRWSLERKIHDFDDSSVYLVKTNTGQFGALKLVRTGTADAMLERERRVLELVGNDLAPALLDFGLSPQGPFLVSDWKSGSVAADAFSELRASPDSRPALLRLAITMVDAYERLHEIGITHGDIQPKNVIIDLRNRAWIIDFANSVVPGLPPPTIRMGVPFFFEPEYAGALMLPDGAQAEFQPPTVRGENYAIAAMLFYLLSGVHCIEFSPERETLLRQVTEAEPSRLMDSAGVGWETVDRFLRPFLCKDPEQRPRSLAPLRDGLHSLLTTEPAAPTPFHIKRLVDPQRKIKAEFGLGSARLREFDLAPPRCSLTYGASGIAYALLRASQLTSDAELLWAADAWIELAELHAKDPEAFTACAIDLSRRRIGYASVSGAEPGLFFVKSLVRASAGDSTGSHVAVEQFFSAATYRPSHHADMNLGGVGLALASDCLCNLQLPGRTHRKLSGFRNQLVARAWQQSPPAFSSRSRLGFAHGVAGMVFAALTIGTSRETSEAAGRLRGMQVMMRRGVRWPVRAGSSYFMPGWCNGVAGHLLMWTKLWQTSGESEDREMMEKIAWGILESRTAMGNLCCGATGQAVSLAAFAAAAGEPLWQRRAQEILDKLQPKWPADDHPQSLYRGELGLMLARLECDSPEPMFPVWGASLVQPRFDTQA
jgi:eukaryotic-like serine/threonine-protein kinase